MSDIILVGQVCMFNEVAKGNLDRCLDNLRLYCDHIVIYDDGSTDNSVAVASQYTPHIIQGGTNDQMNELAHKQLLLEKAKELGATHCFWLDCDEVLDRAGTVAGGLRYLCEHWPAGIDAFSFRESNLWRSQTYVRIDSLFDKARFVRLWRITPDTSFNVKEGVHLQLYPHTIKEIREAPYSVIHYGFWDYKKMLVKIGAHQMDRPTIQNCAQSNWILDERACSCYKLAPEAYPPGCLPPDTWVQPGPKALGELVSYAELPDEPPLPMMDPRCVKEWSSKHAHQYHGNYDSIFIRNRNMLGNKVASPEKRLSLFHFNPQDKVIFDVACGGGWFMIDCLNNGAKKVIGFEIDDSLIAQAERSYQELGIAPESYQFINMLKPLPKLPRADIIYCMAMFMHIPFWQAQAYFRWIRENLADDGEAHLQFHQVDGITMFLNGEDSISDIRLHHELERAGLVVKTHYRAEGEGILPVWELYACGKGDPR